jgi:hypothetical protein
MTLMMQTLQLLQTVQQASVKHQVRQQVVAQWKRDGPITYR